MRAQAVSYKYLVAAVYVVALFMDLLDVTIVYVALPTLGREFDAGPSTLEWVVTGYLLSLAVWVPASGWLGDRFGTRRVFLVAVATFTVGSLCCALAWDIGSLIAFRILQGAGGGMLMPVGLTMLFRAFPAEERPRVGALLLVPSLIAPTLGPAIGGLLVTGVGWRWIFLLNLPLGVATFVFTALFVHEDREPAAARFDPWGFVGSGAGLALVLYALSRAPHAGWTSQAVLLTGLGGLATLAALVAVELRSPAPMLDLRLLSNRTFGVVNLYFFVLFSGWMGITFLVPLYLQDVRGLSALESGLTTCTQALGMILVLRPAMRLAGLPSPRVPLVLGAAGITATTAPLLLLGLDTNLWTLRALLLVRGMAMGLIAVTLQTAPFATIGATVMGRAAALYSVNRHVCSALGIAVLATVLIERGGMASAGGNRDVLAGAAMPGFHAAFAVALMASLGALGLVLLMRDSVTAGLRAPRPGAAAGSTGAG